MDLYPHLKDYLSLVEELMQADIARQDSRIYGLIGPFIKRGGKRVRPALCLLSCSATGGVYQSVIEPSMIIELFHNFTLIHDDIEDDSKFRRGEPTLHVTYGIPIAINSGDALYTLLWQKIVALKIKPKSRLLVLQSLYAQTFKKVVDGQGIEISWIMSGRFDVSESEYFQMINGKTSALIGLSCEVGALLSGSNKKTRALLRTYGENIGTAFQIQDDILNLSGDFDKYKKEIGGDITEGKRTLMVVHSISNSSEVDRNRLISILKSHTSDKKIIEEAISIIKKTGSVDYARSHAVRLVEDAKKLLTKLGDSQDKQALISTADYFISREL